MKLTLPYPVSANAYKRHFCTVDRQHRVRAALTKEAEQFKWDAGWLAKAAGCAEPTACDFAVSIEAYRPRRVGDADNLLKLTLDAMNGIVWEDDRQVKELHVYLRDDRKNPRLEVTIEEVDMA